MSGPRDRFDVDGELEQLAQDLDLDMDAPIGATFAAALRGTDVPAEFEEADYGLDDEGFMTPPPRAEQPVAAKAPVEFREVVESAEEPDFDMASFDDEFGEEPPPPRPPVKNTPRRRPPPLSPKKFPPGCSPSRPSRRSKTCRR